jgi:hypothetical protein
VSELPVDPYDRGDAGAPHYHGFNRPEQTGEPQYTGFRTTEAVPGRLGNIVILSGHFTPNLEIAVPNESKPILGVVSHADRNYPFCVPATVMVRVACAVSARLMGFNHLCLWCVCRIRRWICTIC